MSISFPNTDPSRDWPEDALDTDNGRYLHTCLTCHLPFVGHKRRVPECKACWTVNDTERKERQEWLAEHCDDPEKWVLLTTEEHAFLLGNLSTLLLRALAAERRLERYEKESKP